MISPVVIDNSLKSFFPSSGVGTENSSTSSSVLFSVGTCLSSSTRPGTHWVDVARLNSSANEKPNKLRTSLRGPDLYYCGDYIGTSVGLTIPESVKGVVSAVRNYWSRYEDLLGGLSGTIDSCEIEAELHLYKMKTFAREESRRRALDYMYDFLEDAYEQRNLRMIDHMLYLGSSDLLGNSLSVSFLRATSRARKHLNFWNFYEAKVKESLAGNPDAKKLLKGLG